MAVPKDSSSTGTGSTTTTTTVKNDTYVPIAAATSTEETNTIIKAYTHSTLSESSNSTTAIYPKDFFNIENPQGVFINVDICTGIVEGNLHWTKLISNQNNYFKNLQIDDDGGIRKINLTLFDREFVNLESLIATTIAFGQQKMVETNPTTKYSSSDAKTIIQAEKTGFDAENEDVEITDAIKQLEKMTYNCLGSDAFTGTLWKQWGNVFQSIKNEVYLFESYKAQSTSAGYTFEQKISKNQERFVSAFIKQAAEGGVTSTSKAYDNFWATFVRGATKKDAKYILDDTDYQELADAYYKASSKKISIADVKIKYSSLFVGNKDYINYVQARRTDDAFYNLAREKKVKEGTTSKDEVQNYWYSATATNLNVIKSKITAIDKIINDKKKISDEEAALANQQNNLFELVSNPDSLTPNLRVRYGYNDFNEINRKYNDKTGYEYNENVSLTYLNKDGKSDSNVSASFRTGYNNQNIIRSPYFEFLITGVQSKISREGLFYTLSGFGISRMALDKYKMVQKFAKIKGTPKKILADLMVIFNEKIDNSPINLFLSDKIKDLEEETEIDTATGISKTKEIEIILGSESCYGKTTMYKSIRSILNEFCAACPRKGSTSKVAESDTKTILYADDGTSVDASQTTTEFDYAPLTYKVIDSATTGFNLQKRNTTDAKDRLKSSGTKIIFYYKEPEHQDKIRVYDWGMYRNTLVKDLEINNKNEYAALSSFSMYNKDSPKPFSSTQISNVAIGATKNGTLNEDKILLCNDVIEVGNKTNNKSLTNSIIGALKNSMYEGSITIQGDPFYFFDEVMVPFLYAIRINILRPSGLYDKKLGIENSRVDSSGQAVQSISSGYYAITNISHSISTSGYTTTLNVMSYPGIEKQLKIPKNFSLNLGLKSIISANP